MNDLVIVDTKGIETRLEAAEIKKYIAPTLNESEFWLFLNTAKMFGLNPIKREIYPIKFGNKLQIVTGYQVYVERASRSGLLEYWNVVVEKTEPNKPDTWRGIFTGKRSDWTQEFIWEVPMSEINKNNPQVHLMPEFFLKKNTLSQGLRMMIPEILSGMPYTSEEVSSGVSEDLAPEIMGTSIENNIELSEEERKALEDEKKGRELEEEAKKQDGVKAKALSGYQAKINTFDDFEKLNQWSKVLNIEKHPFKDGILSMIGIRRTELDPTILERTKDVKTQDGPTRKDVIDDIVKTTGAKFADIKAYVTDEMLTGGLVSAMLSGEAGALQEFNEGFAEFLSGQNEPDIVYEAELKYLE